VAATLAALGLGALAIAGFVTGRRALVLRRRATALAAWLAAEAVDLERDQRILTVQVRELVLSLELLSQRLAPALQLVASPMAAPGIWWALRRLRGKPLKRH
jgi:hypothetical protein